MLRAKDISFSIGKKTLLQETTVDFAPGQFHVIMGSNGAGKSTLLKLLAGDHQPSSGKIWLEGRTLQQYSKRELAQKRAVLSQHYDITFPITAGEMVMMGRYPYFDTHPRHPDIRIWKESMRLMEVEGFAERDYNTLSGGEAQKVQMSRVLAQIWPEGEKARVLFLDEPVSHLDVKYQYQLLHTAKTLCREKHTTVIAILHDIHLTLSFADRILFMKQGKIVQELKQAEEITSDIIDEVFDVASKIVYPEGDGPLVIFRSR